MARYRFIPCLRASQTTKDESASVRQSGCLGHVGSGTGFAFEALDVATEAAPKPGLGCGSQCECSVGLGGCGCGCGCGCGVGSGGWCVGVWVFRARRSLFSLINFLPRTVPRPAERWAKETLLDGCSTHAAAGRNCCKLKNDLCGSPGKNVGLVKVCSFL